MTPQQPQELDKGEWLDDILLILAKRIEETPRGKTYDWQAEKQAILAKLKKREAEAKQPLKDHIRWVEKKLEDPLLCGSARRELEETLYWLKLSLEVTHPKPNNN